MTFIAVFFNEAELQVTPEDAILWPNPEILVSPVMKEMDLDMPLLAGEEFCLFISVRKEQDQQIRFLVKTDCNPNFFSV